MAEQTMHEELEEAVSMSKVGSPEKHSLTYEANPNAATVPAPSNGDLAGVHGCGIPMEWRLEGRLPRPGLILRGAKTLGPHGTISALFAKFSRPACRSVILLPAQQHDNAFAFVPICHNFGQRWVNMTGLGECRHGI